MRSILIPCSFILAVSAWAQQPARTPDAPKKTGSAAETAEAKTSPSSSPDEENAAKLDAGDEEDGSPAVLAPATPMGTRGIDLLGRARLDSMIPVGRSHRGVHYPSYRKTDNIPSDGTPVPDITAGIAAQLESLFESDIVKRLDADHIQFDQATWVQYEEKPTVDGTVPPAMTMEIESGVYDLKNEILMTNRPVKIENKQFIIEADGMVHDRASGLSLFTRATMSFFEEEPEPGPANEPPGTPAALPAKEPVEKAVKKTTPAKPVKK